MSENNPQIPPYVPVEQAPVDPVEQKTTSILAIVSTIAGIGGFTFIPFIGAIAALITGYMAKSEIKKSNGAMDGDGFATAGLVMGWINIGLSIMLCMLVLAIMFFTGLLVFRGAQ